MKIDFSKILIICFLSIFITIILFMIGLDLPQEKFIVTTIILAIILVIGYYVIKTSVKDNFIKEEERILENLKDIDNENFTYQSRNFPRLTDKISMLVNRTTALNQTNQQLRKLDEQLQNNNELLRTANAELKNTAAELARKENYLQTIINNQGEGFLLCDTDGIINFINPSFAALINISSENMIGKSIFSLLSEDNCKIMRSQLANRALGVKNSYELWINLSSTEKKCLLVCASPNYDANNNHIGTIAVLSDITKIKNYQHELEIQNIEFTKFQQAVAQNSSGILLIDALGCVSYANNQFETIMGYTNDELKGKTPLSLFDETGNSSLQEYITTLLKSGRAWKGELSCLKKNGGKINIRATISPIKNTNQTILGYAALLEDITKYKFIEQELAETNGKYSIIVENSRDVIWIFNTQKRQMTYYSPSIKQLLGYTVEQALKNNMLETLTPEISAFMTKCFTDASMWHNKTEISFEAKQKTIDGDFVDVEVVMSPIFMQNNQMPTEIVGVSRNISRRKQTELQLRKTNAMLQIILEKIPARIYMKDKNQKYLTVNEQYANWYNLNPKDFEGKTDIELNITPQENLQANNIKAVESGKPVLSHEAYIKPQNSSALWVSLSVLPYFVTSKNPDGIIGIITDITERKLFEQMLLEQNRQFENTIKNLNDIYIRTDLNGIILQASPSICNFVGINKVEEVIGNNIQDYIHNPEAWTIVKNTGKLIDYPFKMKNLKNKTLYCEINLVTFYNTSGKPLGYEGIARNVTERVLHEQQLNSLTEDLMKSLEQAKIQKNIIESAHRGITESINYAKRIQEAILQTSTQTLNNKFKPSFLLYKPCQIVGGDFYYIKSTPYGTVCAVADCTGHGIPGALMSVLAISLLNDIIAAIEKLENPTPSGVLGELRKKVIETLSNSLVIRDGLDISLVFMRPDKRQIMYSGANLPLYICRKNEIITLKPTYCPIGMHPVLPEFENTSYNLQVDDMIYFASDGYQDQFGMNENRKFSKKDFTELLKQASHLDTEAQNYLLQNRLSEWQGTRKQTDDITVLGIKVV